MEKKNLRIDSTNLPFHIFTLLILESNPYRPEQPKREQIYEHLKNKK